jgi:hypothetical protein
LVSFGAFHIWAKRLTKCADHVTKERDLNRGFIDKCPTGGTFIMTTRKNRIPAVAQHLHLLAGEWVWVVLEILWNTQVGLREYTVPDALIKPIR